MTGDYQSALTIEQLPLDVAVEEILAFGENIGVPPAEIAGLLNSGMDVSELLQHLIAKVTQRL